MAPDAKRGHARSDGRERRVERVRAALVRDGAPRLLMSLILAATGAAGFLASFALLHAGLWRMWLRYPLAVLFAYVVFVLLLRLWLHYRQNSFGDDVIDFNLLNADLTGGLSGGPPNDLPACGTGFGGGGDFGGGGSSGSWGGGRRAPPPCRGLRRAGAARRSPS